MAVTPAAATAPLAALATAKAFDARAAAANTTALSAALQPLQLLQRSRCLKQHKMRPGDTHMWHRVELYTYTLPSELTHIN